MTDYFEQEEFDYKSFVNSLAQQVPNLCKELEIDEVRTQYIVTKITEYGMTVGEYLLYWDVEKQKFAIQAVMEWSFHKIRDLYSSGISIEYYNTILDKIVFVVYDVIKEGYNRNLPDKKILQVVEYQVNKVYKLALTQMYTDGMISKEIYSNALEQSSIDQLAEMANKKDNDEQEQNTENDDAEFYSSDYIDKLEATGINFPNSNRLVFNEEARKSILKMNLQYYLTNIILAAIIIYLSAFAYMYLHGMDFSFAVINSTALKLVSKPIFLIGLIVVIGVKDLLKYIFFGCSKEECKYLESMEKENPQVEGIGIINGKNIKARFTLLTSIFSIIFIFLGLLLVNCFKNIVKIVALFAIYYGTSIFLKLPLNDFKHIVFSKEFLILFVIMLGVFKLLGKK